MRLFLALLTLLACVNVQAQETLAADVNESVFKLPSTVTNLYGRSVGGEMTVTQYKPDGDGPFPIAILLHGRAVVDRSLPARQRYLQAARYFVRRGFALWVPTRLGYGTSSVAGDPEDSGDCYRKNYAPGFEAAATSALDVLRYAREQRFTDPTRTVIIGQSFGGMTSIALAGKRPEGVLAFINFAGGNGGNPETRPGEPCAPHLLRALYAGYGKTARAPSLWVYTENDRFFAGGLPQQWFAAFQDSGGAGEFRLLPAFSADGHSLFGQGFEVWRPLVDDFLHRQGYPMPHSADMPPATDFARIGQVDKVPRLSQEAREQYQRFLKLDIPRAFAIGPRGEYAFASARDAVRRAMDACRKFAPSGCALYAVDDHVVWKDEP